ncbi:MAG: LPXTG cell wall anchor domain-containing protein [Oscillospiraceae bacterium]|nr:LPXTG cell wall anchor domain-containing protein [Oscillospiraceae bacterium]
MTYQKGAEKFIFLPGSEYSPTDLFPNFKDVMPGDSIQQKILVKNDAANNCKVKVYMRALGAHEDSAAFLSQLDLTVAKGTDTVMFDAPADQTAQLTDWVCLGTLYSGGECELIVTLDVPVTLDNRFMDLVGYLDWEFAVEELPVEPEDPRPPQTGDESQILLWAIVLAVSLTMIIVLLFSRKKKEKE